MKETNPSTPQVSTITIRDNLLRKAASEGMDTFVEAIAKAILEGIGGSLTADTMPQLNSHQITLLAYLTLRDEVMDGGFVQLIHNGYGPFIFKNPFAKAVKQWGLRDLSKLIYDAHTLYNKYGDEISRECSDEEFMALFERFEEFDEFDDTFVENEEQWTAMMAAYVDDHLNDFVKVES